MKIFTSPINMTKQKEDNKHERTLLQNCNQKETSTSEGKSKLPLSPAGRKGEINPSGDGAPFSGKNPPMSSKVQGFLTALTGLSTILKTYFEAHVLDLTL